jgi:hypothetical protein
VGSKVLKKVILYGWTPGDVEARANSITELKRVVEACKTNNTVELWKENYTVNGKVDLDADVVSFLPAVNPWFATYGHDRYLRQARLFWHESTLM